MIEQTETAQTKQQETIKKLQEQRDEYVKRLDAGAEKIEEARKQGKDVTSWEDYWIQLLRQYETVCDRLKNLQNTKA